jgi:hypothetical protein
MKPNTKDNTQKQVFFTILGGLALVGIGFFGNVVTSEIHIAFLVALASFMICVLLSLYCSVNLLPSGMEIILGGGKAPISRWRVAAGVCFFLLSWGFVIFAAWFNLAPSLFSDVGQTVYGIGIIVVLGVIPGVFFLKKDHELYGKVDFSGTRVLLLLLLIIIQLFVVACIGVLSWMADMITNTNPYNVFGGGNSYPSIFTDVVRTLLIVALVIAVTFCILQLALFLLRKI